MESQCRRVGFLLSLLCISPSGSSGYCASFLKPPNILLRQCIDSSMNEPPNSLVNFKFTTCKPPFLQLNMESVDNTMVVSRTISWVKDWVIGLKLCPWASSVRHNEGLRVLVVTSSADDICSHVATVIEEAKSLESKWKSLRGSAFPTTLIVFPDPSYSGIDSVDPCGAFPASAITHVLEPSDRLSMIAFRRSRV